MRQLSRKVAGHYWSLFGAVSLIACGVEPTAIPSADTDPNAPEGTGTSEPGPVAPGNQDGSDDADDGFIADLRADTNRDGVVSFEGKDDDTGEDSWNAEHGAVFLANIDDDEVACNTDADDVDLPKCHDAADEVVNGPDDALDLARLKTKPWAEAPASATASITFTAEDRVRLFKVEGSSFTLFKSGTTLTEEEIKSGIELAIEGKDIVRNPAVWDGFVDVTLSVTADGKSKTDTVRMRVAPLITYHHLLPAEQVWVSSFNSTGNQALRTDLSEAVAAAGLPAPKGVNTSDAWNQDYFETGYMSMPGPGGTQHAIRVNIRSANVESPKSTTNPLRRAGRVVFALRGKDSAAIQEYDKSRNGRYDTLNSFGNFETVPPYTHKGETFPLGRVIRGNTATYYTDPVFTKMMESQKVQPPIYVDTSWLVVGHIDETISFVKANTPRGWVLLVNDPTMAKTMFQTQSQAGRGSTPLHVGKYWSAREPAQVTINEVLSDTDVMSASAEAAAEIDDQLTIIKGATGLTDAEIIRIPFLHMSLQGESIAYQPGMVNGIYIADRHFVAPDPHGPVINGADIFKTAMSEALAPFNITVHFAEDWDTYHRNLGEVHCATNTTRQIPQAKWWESGR
ncbi:MAG TPA: protein-arginine deiminase family protein [Labilithrix sp.]|nr:protein-arginine deiminase family protein [Labilithrix sp.]